MTGQDWTVCQANEMSLMLMLEAGPSRTLLSRVRGLLPVARLCSAGSLVWGSCSFLPQTTLGTECPKKKRRRRRRVCAPNL